MAPKTNAAAINIDTASHERRGNLIDRGRLIGMGTHLLRLSVCALGLMLVGSVGTAAAQEPQLPVGESKGVRLVRQHGTLRYVFTKRAEGLRKRIAGKRVTASCTDLPNAERLGSSITGGGTETLRMPRRGRVLRTGDLSSWDYCRLWLPSRVVGHGQERHRNSRKLLVSIPLTQQGAVLLDEQAKTGLLVYILMTAGSLADERHVTTWPSASELIEHLDSPFTMVALANPQDSPPPGAVGYYSDAQQHVAVAILSATGRRLFIEFEADDVIHTNTSLYDDNWS